MTHLIDITQGWCPECREPFLVVPNTPNLALLAIKQEFEEYQSLRAAEEAELRRQVAEERRLLARERAELDRRRTLSRPMVDFFHSDSPPPTFKHWPQASTDPPSSATGSGSDRQAYRGGGKRPRPSSTAPDGESSRKTSPFRSNKSPGVCLLEPLSSPKKK